jgi:cyclopropane fatty-acyl-phospholipid synthase-like methyltransferase
MQQGGTVIVDEYRKAATQDAGSIHYLGLRIHALNGLHEFVGSLAARTFATGSEFLDLAAGSGALCLRLKDLGMNPTACDLVEENFRLHDSVPFITANLNQDIPAEFSGRFDGITAIEIVEHLENPRHFLRQCFSALKPGGALILTTPNMDSARSRAVLIRFGAFHWFSQSNYQDDGHITPLPRMLLQNAMAEAGFNILDVTSVGEWEGSFWSSWKLHLFADLLRMFDGCETQQNEILVVLARKPS